MASESAEAFNQSNDGFTDAGIIQLRLDTAPMLDNLEAFFRGKRIIGWAQDKEGKTIPVFGDVGKPKMNEEGVQSLMSWLTPLFSPATVQGNFPSYDDLNDYLIKLECDLNDYVWRNCHNWEISMEEADGIMDMIINVAEPFFSRLVNNKERESYANTMVHRESLSGADKDRFSIFSKRRD